MHRPPAASASIVPALIPSVLLASAIALAIAIGLVAFLGVDDATIRAQEPMEHAVHIPLVARNLDFAELPAAPTALPPTEAPASPTPPLPTEPAPTEVPTQAPPTAEPPATETPALEPGFVRVRFTVSGQPFDAGYGVLEFGPFIELLRSVNGGPWELVSRAETDMDGAVRFEAPPLAPDERYRVRFHNTRELFLDSWLLRWRSRDILPEEIVPGETLDLGDAEVVDLQQVSPETFRYLAFPARFEWAPRPGQDPESYRYGVGECAPTQAGEREHGFTSETLGYVSEYRLPELPRGFQYLEIYCWYVFIDLPDGSEGWSFYHRRIHFCETRNNCPPRAAIPQ